MKETKGDGLDVAFWLENVGFVVKVMLLTYLLMAFGHFLVFPELYYFQVVPGDVYMAGGLEEKSVYAVGRGEVVLDVVSPGFVENYEAPVTSGDVVLLGLGYFVCELLLVGPFHVWDRVCDRFGACFG